ncbi:uncharacterized protein PHACADRAFT_24898 [Phanerochaete carnosa HHB-10118-sp]|uniref:Uncharacterized protein n=1 Tax=Phanerochaete carnosa (strain HHB-10118-sp) TaxID=650164 RepID=K5WR57_PHACS|nr:uncharacterized protein PHACADRAFT_24898 [Phanerochaete carnosa HHB-10118-sp]EKM61744.1 hypothetical protein PHACADRAFT_24898 [Phanerochaete carnosa HHB-10118-sp]
MRLQMPWYLQSSNEKDSEQLSDASLMSVNEPVNIYIDDNSDSNINDSSSSSSSSVFDLSRRTPHNCKDPEEDRALQFQEDEEYKFILQDLEEAAKELDIGVELEQECNFYDLHMSVQLHAKKLATVLTVLPPSL